MNAPYKKVVTHDGNFHADEIFAIAVLVIMLGYKPMIARTRSIGKKWLMDPTMAIIDVGERYEPELGNFDHHQDANLPASNILILEALNPWWKDWIVQNLFSYISDVDKGIIPSGGYSFGINSIIRVHNTISGGFDMALSTALTTLHGFIGEAEIFRELEKVWSSLHRVAHDKVAIIETENPVYGWELCAKKDDTLLLASPIKEGWRLISRDPKIIRIPASEKQLFLHKSGFMALYPNRTEALRHAEAIIEANT